MRRPGKTSEYRGAAQEDAAQHQGQHPVRMGFGIHQSQRRSPGTTEHQPAIDAESFADDFHIGDQCLRVITLQTGMGRGPSATTLVEQYNTVPFGIEKPAVIQLTARTRAAMHKHCRQTVRVTAFFHVQAVPVSDRNGVRLPGLNRWKQRLHGMGDHGCQRQ